jgi:hypothetical protein
MPSRSPRSKHRALSVESLECRSLLATTPFSVSFRVGGGAFDIAAAEDGLLVVGLGGDQPVVTKLNFEGQVSSTINLTLPAGYQHASLFRISDDGRFVDGTANNSSGANSANPGIEGSTREVIWDLEHPDSPVVDSDPEFQAISGFLSVPPTASADGRVKASGVQTDRGTAVAISVDGRQELLRAPDGQVLIGTVEQLQNGIGGDPTQWIAIGVYYTPNLTDYFIAFSDGSVMRMGEFLNAQASTDEYLSVTDLWGMVVADDSIYFVNRDSHPLSYGLVSTGVQIMDGYSLVGIPLPEECARSRLDVSDDGHISPVDALIIINALNDRSAAGVTDTSLPTQPKYSRVDVSQDGRLSPVDALLVINFLNHTITSSSDGANNAEGESPPENLTDEFAALASLDTPSGTPTSRKKGI